jgi:hypothetical protein
MFSKVLKWIILFSKELISVAIVAVLIIGCAMLLCRKKPVPPPPVVNPTPSYTGTTHTTTPIIGSTGGHTHIVIPIVHRDTLLPPGLQLVPRESVIVDIDQDVSGHITITSKPDSIVGNVAINRTKSALIHLKPGLGVYAGFCGSAIDVAVTAGVAIDIIEVWKFSVGANAGVRNISSEVPWAIDVGGHATYNLNKHVGLTIGRTWRVYKSQGDPKWMLGVAVKLIGG